ncbi:hypothetical protein KC356_g210 [Hortaea werneckii]|nr:hypothetical protein KC356_g210 [Hortaea werneckii]
MVGGAWGGGGGGGPKEEKPDRDKRSSGIIIIISRLLLDIPCLPSILTMLRHLPFVIPIHHRPIPILLFLLLTLHRHEELSQRGARRKSRGRIPGSSRARTPEAAGSTISRP